MPATKGNQFWKLIKPENLGRPSIFKTPEDLWGGCVNYFKECDNNPMKKTETTVTSKGLISKEITFHIPYTWEGLYIFLGVCNLEHYKKKKDFSNILTHIGNIIRNQKYSGAAAGIFSSAIIARDLGLIDKSERTTKEKAPDLSKLSEDDLLKYSEIQNKINDSDTSD